MAHQGARVNIGKNRNPELFHELVRHLLRAPVGTDLRKLAHDQPFNVRTNSFIVLGIGAVISYFRIGQDDDLPSVRGVCENLLIAGDGSIKNYFARALAFSAVAFASEDSAVFERKDRLHWISWERIFKF